MLAIPFVIGLISILCCRLSFKREYTYAWSSKVTTIDEVFNRIWRITSLNSRMPTMISSLSL